MMKLKTIIFLVVSSLIFGYMIYEYKHKGDTKTTISDVIKKDTKGTKGTKKKPSKIDGKKKPGNVGFSDSSVYKTIYEREMKDPMAYATVSPREGLIKIFNRLKQAAGIREPLVLQVSMTPSPNAWMASDGKLTVTRGELAFCNKEPSCLAGTIGHELGHWKLKHVRGNNYDRKQQERDADIFGTTLATKSGFECMAAAKYFKKVLSMYGDSGGDNHPNNSERVQYLTNLCNRLGAN